MVDSASVAMSVAGLVDSWISIHVDNGSLIVSEKISVSTEPSIWTSFSEYLEESCLDIILYFVNSETASSSPLREISVTG